MLELLSRNNNQKKTFKWNNFSRMYDKTKRGNYNHLNNFCGYQYHVMFQFFEIHNLLYN